jgi:hypothetical protein
MVRSADVALRCKVDRNARVLGDANMRHLVVCAVVYSLVAPALAGLTGPTYDINGDEPGDGYTYALLDDFVNAGRAGGVVASHSDIDPGAYIALYWGPAAIYPGVTHAVQAAMDGSADQPGEDLQFSLATSDLANGVARWIGTTSIWIWDNDVLVQRACDVRFTITVAPSLLDAATVPGIDVENGVGAVYDVTTPSFTANLLFEAKYTSGGAWTPMVDFFDSQPNGGPSSTIMSLDFGFWYQTTLGDMNCDGAVSAADIDPFVLALTGGQAAYEALWPDCDFNNADINGDGSVSAADIDGFVQVLTGN